MTPAGNYMLARAMFQQIAGKLPVDNGQALREEDIPSESECERALAFTSHDQTRIAAEMLQRLQRPPFTNQLNHSDQVLRLMIKAQASDQNPADTSTEYQWAIAQEPDDRVLHYNYGLFLFGFNRDAGIAQLRMSRPWDGFPVFTPDGTPVD
jgi:Tfp pilus assembly protein PilF